MPTNLWSARIGLVALTSAAVGTVAAPAWAAGTGVVTASSAGGNTVNYIAASGTVNRVTLTRSGTTIIVDDVVAIKAGAGCTKVKNDKTRVKCTFSGTPNQISVSLGGKNDTLADNAGVVLIAHGGAGNDTITGGTDGDTLYGDDGKDTLYGRGGRDRLEGGAGADRLYGGARSDWLYGGSGADLLHGESGNDYLRGNTGDDSLYGDEGDDQLVQETTADGADVLNGGSGTDLVNYEGRKTAVVADLDGAKRDDGSAGEHDSIAKNVENLNGGYGNDVLTGNDTGNRIYGGYQGDDKLYGRGGADVLNGFGGSDLLDGGSGNDYLMPDAHEYTPEADPDIPHTIAADVIRGGSGFDAVDYSDREVNPVRADLTGTPGDDGREGEGDTVGADVEEIIGTPFGDHLIGNASGNVFWGGEGDDVIEGGGGADLLFGQGGDDELSGDDLGTDAADQLDGGPNGTLGDLCTVFPGDTTVNCER
ncbi:calcium-binding protein [Actinoplanes sp. NPDC051851]|uniref:calcium-binding protein n=1 Tax=Actinoplanes sp. NPDC051851 TaxID=3154753 RepID=UPI0034411741